MYNRTSTYDRNVRLSAIASQSQLTFLLKNPTDKYRRAAASAQYGMHQMSPSSLSPFGNRLLQTALLGFITHLDFLSAQMALVSTFFQMFIVFGMYDFALVTNMF